MSGQVHDGLFWVRVSFGRKWQASCANVEKGCQIYSVRQEPSFYGSDSDPELHEPSRLGQPTLSKRWSAVGVVVKVHQDEPRAVFGGLVIGVQAIPQILLSILNVHRGD